MIQVKQNLAGAGLRIGVVLSRFNASQGEALLKGCSGRLHERGVTEGDITLVTVPGALEIPLTLQAMAKSGRFDALIALGIVIRGDTYHFEIVSNESASGVSQVQLDTGIPIANAILTTNTEEQADARTHEKGAEAADVAIEMAHLLKDIDALR